MGLDGLGSPRVSPGLIEYAQNIELFVPLPQAVCHKMRNELENNTWMDLQRSPGRLSCGDGLGEAEPITLLLCSGVFLMICGGKILQTHKRHEPVVCRATIKGWLPKIWLRKWKPAMDKSCWPSSCLPSLCPNFVSIFYGYECPG